MRRQQPLSKQLKNAILNADKTRYRIAKETGVPQSALSRFVNGLGGLSIPSIDKIGKCLGLEISVENPPEKKGG